MGKSRNPWATLEDAIPAILARCIQDTDTGCVFYASTKPHAKYTTPTVRIAGLKYQVSKVLWYAVYGAFPVKWLLHTCDNCNCVNIFHMHEGTQTENMQEMNDRWRHPGKKLGDSERKIIQESILSGRELAEIFDVSPSLVSQIRRYK